MPSAHNAAMRKRLNITLAVLFLALAGVVAWHVLHLRGYKGRWLRVVTDTNRSVRLFATNYLRDIAAGAADPTRGFSRPAP
jgi:hypothetical protein